MTNNTESKELLEMKEQLSLLVQKLEKETIVNERLIRRSMKEKASWLHRRLIIESSVCLLMIPFFLYILPRISPVSMYFCSYSALFMLLAICYNYYMYRRFHPKNFIEGNLIEAKKETLNFKKQTQRWTFYIGIPFLITYVVFFVYEKMQYYQGEILNLVLISGAIGMIIGGAIGINIFMKMLRATDEILKQIEELEEKAE